MEGIQFTPLSVSEWEAFFANPDTLKILKGGSQRAERQLQDGIFHSRVYNQRGGGIFSFLKSAVLPLVKRYVLPTAASFVSNVATDLSDSGGQHNWRDSMCNRGKQAMMDMGQRVLRGGGGKRKEKRKTIFHVLFLLSMFHLTPRGAIAIKLTSYLNVIDVIF